MKITAIAMGIVATIAMGAAIYFYWILQALICFDACPSVAEAGAIIGRSALYTLAPAVVVAGVSWAITLRLARAQNRATAFVLVLIAPMIVTMVGVAILFFVGGSLTPVGISYPPGNSQVSTHWLAAVDYAIVPLIVWPLFSLIMAFPTAPARRA